MLLCVFMAHSGRLNCYAGHSNYQINRKTTFSIGNEEIPLTCVLAQVDLLLKQIIESLASIQQVETAVDELQGVRAFRSTPHRGWRTKTTQNQR